MSALKREVSRPCHIRHCGLLKCVYVEILCEPVHEYMYRACLKARRSKGRHGVPRYWIVQWFCGTRWWTDGWWRGLGTQGEVWNRHLCTLFFSLTLSPSCSSLVTYIYIYGVGGSYMPYSSSVPSSSYSYTVYDEKNIFSFKMTFAFEIKSVRKIRIFTEF